MFRRHYNKTMALAALGICLCAALAIFGYWYFATPNHLTIAVGPPDSPETRLLSAYAQTLPETHKDVRLRIQSADDLRASAALLERKRVEFAVVRPDVLLPGNGRTVAILRTDAVIVLAPSADKPDDLAKLARKRLGVINRDEVDASLLKTLIDHYQLADEISLVSLASTDIEGAIGSRRIDALIFVGPATSQETADIARAAARAWNGRLTVVPVVQAGALAKKNPLLSEETIPVGGLLGRPALPGEEVKTIGVSYRLMSRPEVDRTVVSRVAQYLFQQRARIAQIDPSIHLMRAPETDTSTTAVLPNHLGANDYFHREQRTFMDDYGDWIWIALFAGGGLSSALVWAGQLLRRNRREVVDKVIDRLLAIASESRKARTKRRLDKLAGEIDSLVANAIRYSRRRMTTSRAMSSMILAIDTARAAVAERRRELLDTERFQDASLDPASCSPAAAAAAESGDGGE